MIQSYCLEVKGDYACFTRPEMKVERVSYDVMTPSAARAVFESILWKPAIRWVVEKIEVLRPIRWMSIRRNEVGCVVSIRNAETAMKTGRGELGIYVEEERQQRAGLVLRDVAYRIHAHFEMTEHRGENDHPIKISEMFTRRARNGQCFNQPYLGCREFAADFKLVTLEENNDPSIDESRSLGLMLYDIDFKDLESPVPKFFIADLVKGVVYIPSLGSSKVMQ
jgi:CRISPR-associated protein Cas5d